MNLPISGQFELTERCNLSCRYCYNHFRDAPSKDNPYIEEVARKISENELFYVVITGGEPFINKEALQGVASIFYKNNMDFSVNTNLTLADRNDLKRLKEKGMISILTSVISCDPSVHDYISQEDGSFDETMRGLETVKREKIHVAVNMVINKKNKDQVYETGKFLIDNFGINSFCATALILTPGRDVENLAISAEEYVSGLEDLLRLEEDTGINVETLHPPLPCMFSNPSKFMKFLQRSCVGGVYALTISPYGGVRPCSHSDKEYGNVNQEKLKDIFSKMQEWRTGELTPKDCSSCAEVEYCKGGCRIAAFTSTGSLNGAHPYKKMPLKEKIKRENPPEELPSFSAVKIKKPDRNLKYREETDGNITVYVQPKAFATLTKTGFKLLKYLYSMDGENLGAIEKECGVDLQTFTKMISFLKERKLLYLSQ